MENVTKEIIEFDPTSPSQVQSLMENEMFREYVAGMFTVLYEVAFVLNRGKQPFEGVVSDDDSFELKLVRGFVIPES